MCKSVKEVSLILKDDRVEGKIGRKGSAVLDYRAGAGAGGGVGGGGWTWEKH